MRDVFSSKKICPVACLFSSAFTACPCYSVRFTTVNRRSNRPALQRAANGWINRRVRDSKSLERVAMEQKMLKLLSERALSMRYIPPPVRTERVLRMLDVGVDLPGSSA